MTILADPVEAPAAEPEKLDGTCEHCGGSVYRYPSDDPGIPTLIACHDCPVTWTGPAGGGERQSDGVSGWWGGGVVE